MRKFEEMTQAGKEFVQYLLNERLQWWREHNQCTIEASDVDIEVCSECIMNGTIVSEVMKIVEVYDLGSYIKTNNDQITIRVY